jgi:hypothetical protein
MVACGLKKEQEGQVNVVYAIPESKSYLPLEMFAEDGKIYVRYIKDGIPMEKINLVFKHEGKTELWDDEVYVLYEIINEQKGGQYYIPIDLDAECYYALIYVTNKDTVYYSLENRYYETKKGSNNYIDKIEKILQSDIFTYEKMLVEDLKDANCGFSEYYTDLENGICNEYDNVLTNVFKNWILSTPTTMNHPFKRLVDGGYCHILTSEDGNLRFYVWGRVGMEGTLGAVTDELVQYKDNEKVFAYDYRSNKVVEGMYPGNVFFDAIYEVVINNKKYYLVESSSYLHMDMSSSNITAYSIENEKLKEKKIFKTKKGKTAGFDVSLDYIGVHTPDLYYEKHKLHYDYLKQVLYVPVIENDEFQGQYSLYQLKGNYFEYVGTK